VLYSKGKPYFVVFTMQDTINKRMALDGKAIALEYITPRSRRRIFRQVDTNLPCVHEQIPFAGGQISIRSWGDGDIVLMVHGWSANQSDMFDFVPAITERGYRAVTFDLPAHGESSGKIAGLDHLAAGIIAVGVYLGAVHGVIAHSVGCAATSIAIAEGALNPARATMLAPPESYEQFARQYGKARGLDHVGVDSMIQSLKDDGIRVALFSSDLVAKFEFPGLVIHSADDDIIPITVGQHVAQSWPGCRFVQVEQLGHRGILKDNKVVDLVIDFIAAPILSQG
jgi:pimeloyl-ACP methyl ester carboxylesterase